MQVSNPNNVKIYNLSAGKSLPEWLTDRKKRKLQQTDTDIQRRIELIQDFEMPCVSNCVKVSKDKNYICATGTYKPRIRCYDVHQMSMKFERGLDAEVVKFIFLSDDYSKLLFLQDDRYIEFHTQFGRHHRTRIPKFGRDLSYHQTSCDAYFVGVSPEIYRFNLERGQFGSPLTTDATEVLCCEFNPQHYLFACGTKEGTVECWDPRDRTRAGVLDTATSKYVENLEVGSVPEITSLKFRDGLTMGLGTSTGHVLLYDIRSNKPFLTKDHMYDLPIRDITFHEPLDLVLSMDSKIVKLWDRNSGKPYTSIEPGPDLNNLCLVPESGLIFIANEAPKILTYYIPSLGTAPKWCAFLDNLTEELEESSTQTVYDDYKFITRKELEELGLSHLIGSNLLRSYMHGFFVDIRLYRKAKSIADPFAYEEYRKDQVRKKIEEDRTNRVKTSKLPSKAGVNPLKDDRFKLMFENPDFQIDTMSEEYRLLNPVMARLEQSKQKDKEKVIEKFEQIQEEWEGRGSSESSSSSSDDDEEPEKPTRPQQSQVRSKKKPEKSAVSKTSRPKFFEMKEGEQLKNLKDNKKKQMKRTLAERLSEEAEKSTYSSIGNKEMTFKLQKSYTEKAKAQELRDHKAERRKLGRSANAITREIKAKPKFWMGKRVQ
ncbi:hypothetical protein BaRGS_00004763 [Batillaria attramentaria]|uniref:Nucleolar protein 10 n=1 Tax=Batillaria attramentaria TaxID=370345 RepID=A0ABD0LY22_9CAEN